MILSIISVDLITKQKKTTKVFNLFYIISDFTIMTMKKKQKALLYILLQYYSSPFFLLCPSFLLFSFLFFLWSGCKLTNSVLYSTAN